MTFEELAETVFFWRWKSAVQLREEIEEEIRFHLEASVQQLEASGLSNAEARAEALQRFGDVERAKLDCLTIQMGERILLQKIQWVIIAGLLLALAGLGLSYAATVARQRELAQVLRMEAEASRQRALESAALVRERHAATASGEGTPAGERRALDGELGSPLDVTAAWRARFLEQPENWRHGFAIAQELAAQLEPQEGLRVLRELWSELSVVHRQQVLKAIAFERGHAATLGVMHLGATDASLEVQGWAFQYLRDYAYRSFADDYPGYLAWYERWKDTPPDEVLTRNAQELVEGLRGRAHGELADELRDLQRLDLRPGEGLGVDLPGVLREAGALSLLEAWLASEDEAAIERAYSWAASVEPDEGWLRAHVLPALYDEDPVDIGGAVRALGQAQDAWVRTELVAYLERSVLIDGGLPRAGVWSAAQALAQLGDASVIPTLIGLIAAHPCYDTVYGLGYFGLGKLTGVSYDESHDGDWWRTWWQENLGRFQPDVRSLAIPDYDRR